MPAGLDDLACFVPTFIKRRLREHPAPLTNYVAEQFPAALLFADISGFTPLANRLAERGPEGAEELNRIVNAYFGELVDLIYGHGGDVVAYAGDASFAIWPADQESVATVAQRAVQCGLEIQRRLHNYQVTPDVRLSMRVSVTAGDMLAAQVGGIENYWQLVVMGSPMDQLRTVDQYARVGDVVLSPHVWQITGDAFHGERLPESHFRARGVTRPLAPVALPRPDLPSEAEAALRSFVPRVVLSRYDAGHGEWMSELRRVTVIFLKLAGLTGQSLADAAQFHTVMQIMQSQMCRYGGTVVQLRADDKGTVGIACFGLPPSLYEDNAVRAISAATAIQTELRKVGFTADIGISTGRMFCGACGSNRRREYTITGDVVNLAARLMQCSREDILCDGNTEQATRGKASFERLPQFKLKGLAEPVTVFRSRIAGTEKIAEEVVGRAVEEQKLTEFVKSIAAGEGKVLVIEGEAGVGKSTLVQVLLRYARAAAVRTLIGECTSIERQTPYFSWRGVFSQLLRLDSTGDAALGEHAVSRCLAGRDDLREMMSLLNPVLGVDFPVTEIVTQLSGRARAENLHRLLASILVAATEGQLLIVLEDVQWQDSASWALAWHLVQSVSPLAIVFVTRPPGTNPPQEFSEIVQLPQTLCLALNVLPRDDTIAIVQRRLGGWPLSTRLADYLYQQSNGIGNKPGNFALRVMRTYFASSSAKKGLPCET